MSLTTPPGIRRLQQKLYGAAKAEPGRRFHQLYDKVYRADILAHAYDRVRAAKGARTPGVDGQTIADIEAQGRAEWLTGLQAELRTKTYRPQPVQRVMIPKAGGGERPLGIPTVRDRVVQTAAKLVLEPIFEADFVDGAYGYRPQRSAQDAVRAVHQALDEGYTDVVDADLSKYFDTIPHHELMLCVAKRVVDRDLLHLIKMWLTVPVETRDKDTGKRTMSGGKDTTQGTPQGGVISPLLANIYIHRFLKAWRDQGKGQTFRGRVVNYADDFVILSRGRARAALDWTRNIMRRIGLTLNEQKTCIRAARREPFHFLGYRFGPLRSRRTGQQYIGATPGPKALARMRATVRALLRPGNMAPWRDVVKPLNQSLRGWANYYRYGTVKPAYDAINWAVLDQVHLFLSRRHHVPLRSMWRRYPAKKVYSELGVYQLYRQAGVSTLWAAT
ncbi:MAG: group II intron reverse transcriptase/maturase [Terriglobales bacterium]